MIKRIFEILFLVFTFLSFVATTYTPPWTSSSMEFFSFVALFFLFFSIDFKDQKIFISDSFIFSILLILATLFCFLWGVNYSREKSVLFYLYIIAFLICGNCIKLKSEYFFIKILICVLLSGIFNGFVIFSQYFEVYSSSLGVWIAEYDESHGRPYGNFGQPNLVSTLLLTSLCISVFLYHEKIIGFISLSLVAIFFGITLALPSSKTAFLCLFILISASAFLKDRKSFFIFNLSSLFLVMSKLLASNTRNIDGSDLATGRFELWMTMLNALWASPWIGYGALNTRIAHFNSRELDIVPRGQVIGSSHNLLLDFLVWFGLFFGVFISIYFIRIIIKYAVNNKNSFSRIYLILPILIHSQLEYPLFYANFLFIFSFILNSRENFKTTIKIKSAPLIAIASLVILLLATTIDYIDISKKYTELRFFNNNFLLAEKPNPLSPLVLDLTGGQFNIFLKDKIKDENDLKYVMNITKSMPSIKNYKLIIDFLRKNNYSEKNIDFWLNKARASFTEKEILEIERVY